MTSVLSPSAGKEIMNCLSSAFIGLSSLNQASSGVGLPTALQVNVAVSPGNVSTVLMGTTNLGACVSGFTSLGSAKKI